MEQKKARDDAILYAVLTVFGIVFYLFIIPTQIFMSKTAQAESFSPDTFPNAVTGLFTIASFVGFIYALFRYRKASKNKEESERNISRNKREIIGMLMPLMVFVLVGVYAYAFHKVGFIPATIVVPPIILFIIGCRKVSYYVIYYCFSACMYLLFRYVLMVPIH